MQENDWNKILEMNNKRVQEIKERNLNLIKEINKQVGKSNEDLIKYRK